MDVIFQPVHPIHLAALEGDRARFQTILAPDQEVIALPTDEGYLPLECAAVTDRAGMVYFILTRREIFSVPGWAVCLMIRRATKMAVCGESPRAWAFLEWYMDYTTALTPGAEIHSGIDETFYARKYKRAPTPIFAALRQPEKDYANLQWILWCRYCDVEKRDAEDLTPFARAVKDKRWKAALMLYDEGADMYAVAGVVDKVLRYNYKSASFLALQDAVRDHVRFALLKSVRQAVDASQLGGAAPPPPTMGGYLQARVAQNLPLPMVAVHHPEAPTLADLGVQGLVGLGPGPHLPPELFRKVMGYFQRKRYKRRHHTDTPLKWEHEAIHCDASSQPGALDRGLQLAGLTT